MTPKKTILVVEDSISVRQAICAALDEAGYEHLEAEDGAQAIERLDGRRINLILCDVNMPNMDGISFVKKMKTMERYRFTPVVMLTTETMEEKVIEGQMAGAKAWMYKPFRPERMLAVVKALAQP
jgi:two-component system chemotaxis response regulator CheY